MGGDDVESILKFLEEGDRMIRFSVSRNAVLVLGDTGTGKTTLTHFLALNNDQMIAVAKGRGDYVIKDNTKQICESTIDSCTVIPELVIDQRANNTAYYDCPGFSDTRSVAHDIGATYFIQKVIQHADSVKIVFTISYDSVRQGGDRHAFMNLAKNIFSMFTDIGKFGNSVCLAVTKVDNIMEEVDEDEYKLVPDDAMVQNIVTFMKEARDDVKAKLKANPTMVDKQFYQNTITLINIFTDENQPNNPNIGIFRRPNKKGPLSEIKMLQKGKLALQNMIYKQLKYTACNKTDFGYTISDNSKLYLNALKDSINANIIQNISEIGQQLIENYSKLEESSNNIDDLTVDVKAGYIQLSNLTLSIDDDARSFVIKVVAVFNELAIDISEKCVQQLFNYCGYLEFIQSLTQQSASQPTKWSKGLKDAVKYLGESHDWYSFLIDLRTTLSEYSIQKESQKYVNVKNKLLTDITNHNIESAMENLKEFLSKVNEKVSGRKFEILDMMKLDGIKLRFLGELMKVAFTNVDAECTDNKLVVKGNHIKMNDIVMMSCYQQSQIVEIFALSKVFFDADFRKLQGLLSIIVPELEVVNEPLLILDGTQGPSYEKAANTGENGKPGHPGGSAGSLVVVGQTCTNCNQLSISAVGGKGGRGQDGGEGLPASEPEEKKTPAKILQSCDPDVWESRWKFAGFDPSCAYSHYTMGGGRTGFPVESTTVHCTVPGKNDNPGGNGGDGGIGGLEGQAGHISWIFDNSHSGTYQPTLKPVGPTGTGEGGPGGRGGQGGKHGSTLHQHSGWNNRVSRKECLADNYVEDNTWSKQGTKGTDNKNDIGRASPEPINFNPSLSVNQYKNYLRQNMRSSITDSTLNNFLQFIETDDKVNDLYGTKDLVDDLLIMESILYDPREEATQIRSYKNFLERVIEHAAHPRNNEKDDHKLVLGYLYTSIMSKICRIKENTNTLLVVDIKGYLKLVKEDIKEMEDLSRIVEKNKSKAMYQKNIDDKVNEANNLISNEILPNINNTTQKLRDNMKSLLDETIELEEQAETEVIKLIEYRKQLEAQMAASVGLGILQGVGQVLGFLGPTSSMIGSTIGLVNTVASDLLVNGASGDEVIFHLPKGVNKLLGELKEEFKQKQELYKIQLSKAKEMLTEVKDDSAFIPDLKKKIDQIQKELEEAIEKATNGDRTAIENSYKLKKDLKASLEESLGLLKKQEQSSSDKTKTEKCITVVSKIQNIVSMADIGVDIYKTVRKARSSIETVDEAIKQKEEDIAKLKEYEKLIYSTMLPLVEGIKDKVENATKTSAGKSHAALDVSSWEVQTAIREIKKQLNDMSNGFETQGEIVNNIDEVIYAMTTIMQVYDHIQYYYDQAQLADYISEITSNQAQMIKVDDPQIQEAIDKLKFEMQKNIVLAEYEKSMSAARQYVFPFGEYTEMYNLPVELRIANTSQTLPLVIDNIVAVIGKLETDVKIIRSGDEDIFPRQIFNSRENENPPFYVWKYSTSQYLIQELLRGNEAMLNADIVRGIQENAIKFDRIGIYFKANCNQIQNDLNTALEEFSIKLTHLGESYYRCGRKFFMMTHGHIEIQHSMNMKYGDYFNQNEVYEKIKNNDPLLSPYGMWKVKLIGDNFNNLANFISHNVDIELEGRGSYLNHKEDNTICTNELNKYYQDVSDTMIRTDLDSSGVVDSNDMEDCEKSRGLAAAQNTPQTNQGIIRKAINSEFQYLSPIKSTAHNISAGKHIPTMPNTTSKSTLANASNSTFEAIIQYSFDTNTNNSSAIQSVNYNLLDVPGNLILADMLFRTFTKNHTRDDTSRKRNPRDEEYAHTMAYNAYAPLNQD